MDTLAASTAGSEPLSELFSRALGELDVERRARDSGVRDEPAPSTIAPDSNEREFVAYFSNKLREKRKQCEANLSQLALDRAATAAKIDIYQTHSSLSKLFNAIEPDLARQRQDHQQDLERAKDHEARSLRYLRYFQLEHGLGDRAADTQPSILLHYALVALFAVGECVALSVFYAEGSDFGLLGGILIALTLSLTNIGLAVWAGIIARYFNHQSIGRRVAAVVAVLLLGLVFLLSITFAAHYRNAARELANTEQSQSMSSMSMLEQLRKDVMAPTTSGQDDQFRASKLAWQQFREHVFFTDVMSWALVFLSIVFGMIAFWKGYSADDRYPHYGPRSRQYGEARAAYEDARKKYTDAVNGIFEKAGGEQQELLRNVRREIGYFQHLASRSESQTNQYQQLARQMTQTCNDVVFRYRELNRHVAMSAAPIYFTNPVHLDAALLEVPAPVTDREKQLLVQYGQALNEFTQLVEKDDAVRQQLRTRELGKLDEFFARIERATHEKLRAEHPATPARV